MKLNWQKLSLVIVGAGISMLASGCGQAVFQSIAPTTLSPDPTVLGLAPTFAIDGAASQTLTITGTGFQSSTSVTYNGSPHTATLISPQQLTISLSQSDLATPGNYTVAVTNKSPGGGSATATFQVWQKVSDPMTGISLALPPFKANLSLSSVTTSSGAIQLYPGITQPGSTTSASSFFLEVYPNPSNLSLEQWFEATIDANGTLLSSGAYQQSTLPDGRMILINQSGAPAAYYAAGGDADFYYAYAETPTGQVVAIERSWEDDLYDQGYLSPSVSLTGLEISVLSTVRY